MSTVYVIGHSKTQQDNPIQHSFNSFFMTFLIDRETDIIQDVSGTFILPETTAFIKTLFTGRSILESTESIWNLIESRYWGSSQKAIHIAFKDAQKQYQINISKFTQA